MPNNLSQRTPRTYYALHVRRKSGRQQTEYNRRGELPKVGESIAITHRGEPINVPVVNVITAPAGELARPVHYVYAVET